MERYSLFHRMLAGDDDHGHSHSEDDEKLIIARIILIITILLSGLAIFAPYTKCMGKSENAAQEETVSRVCKGRLASYSICFAAGMLLSLSVVHILPEALELHAEYLKEHGKEHAGGHDHRRLLEFVPRFLAEETKKASETKPKSGEAHA